MNPQTILKSLQQRLGNLPDAQPLIDKIPTANLQQYGKNDISNFLLGGLIPGGSQINKATKGALASVPLGITQNILNSPHTSFTAANQTGKDIVTPKPIGLGQAFNDVTGMAQLPMSIYALGSMIPGANTPINLGGKSAYQPPSMNFANEKPDAQFNFRGFNNENGGGDLNAPVSLNTGPTAQQMIDNNPDLAVGVDKITSQPIKGFKPYQPPTDMLPIQNQAQQQLNPIVQDFNGAEGQVASQAPALTQYEEALNSMNVPLMEKLRLLNPGNARFAVHLQIPDIVKLMGK